MTDLSLVPNFYHWTLLFGDLNFFKSTYHPRRVCGDVLTDIRAMHFFFYDEIADFKVHGHQRLDEV